jgi:hypothetical protein
MATDPPTAPLPHGQPAAEKPCPRHGTRYHYGDFFCVKCSAERVFGQEDAPPAPPRPTFNHTREDGPPTPCAECAALLPREVLLVAYDHQRTELVNVYAQLAVECAAKHEARRALEDLKAAGTGTPETHSAGTPVGLQADIERLTFERQNALGLLTHEMAENQELRRKVAELEEAGAPGPTPLAPLCLREVDNGCPCWLYAGHQGDCVCMCQVKARQQRTQGDPLLVGLLPAGGQVGRVR